jgi:dolichyl-phosphate beta-glucosyltransferase
MMAATAPPTAPARPDVSFVIPAYNEARRLPGSLAAIGAYLTAQRYRAEVIVVDDGSRDGTAEAAYRAARRFPATIPVRLLYHARRLGKGAAVRSGCLAAQGRFVIYMDADLAVPVTEAGRILQALLDGCDIAIGTRVQPDGRDMRASQPARRRVAGQSFTAVRRLVAARAIRDTQCPMKGFRDEVVPVLFRAQRLRGWVFDAEILDLAQRRGYSICEVPVVWRHVEGGNLQPGPGVAVRVAADLVRLRALHPLGR